MAKRKHGFSGIELKTESNWNVEEWNDEKLYGYRFLPSKIKGEGFFLSVLRKNESTYSSETSSSNNFISWMPDLCNENEVSSIKNWVKRLNQKMFIDGKKIIFY